MQYGSDSANWTNDTATLYKLSLVVKLDDLNIKHYWQIKHLLV